MTAAHDFVDYVERLRAYLQLQYDETSAALVEHKRKISTLNLAVARGETTRAKETLSELNSSTEHLDRLTGLLILRSKTAWEDYGDLEGKCDVLGLDRSVLGDLRLWCERVERLASDLLCFSLGRYKS